MVGVLWESSGWVHLPPPPLPRPSHIPPGPSPQPPLNRPPPPVAAQVRSDLNNEVRKKVNTLIIIDVHARDIIDAFVRDSVMDAREFAWESQLRFYWDRPQDDINIRQCTGMFRCGPGQGHCRKKNFSIFQNKCSAVSAAACAGVVQVLTKARCRYHVCLMLHVYTYAMPCHAMLMGVFAALWVLLSGKGLRFYYHRF